MQLSSNEKEVLGSYLPKILKAYSAPNLFELYEGLVDLSFCVSDIDNIVSDFYTPEYNISAAKNISMFTFKVFNQCGVFNSPLIREHFNEAGFKI